MKQSTNLTSVPETMLWTLHNRAVEAMRPDGIIQDEHAARIYQSIDYHFERSFGKAEPSHAVRSLDFDREINAFLEQHPEGTIVNLGEGLETQRFRVSNNKALWLSIDLPESIEIRERFIQPDKHHLHLSYSAFDRMWFENVPKDKPLFISAQGLFMYFKEQDVVKLIKDIAATFDNWRLMFDTIPIWLSNKSTSATGWEKTPHYTTPKMPWGINRNQLTSYFQTQLPSGLQVTDLGYSNFPRGMTKWVFMALKSLPIIKNNAPTIVKIEPVKFSK
ncbi:class I SAM-dependent methyltransferase [Pseudoalteromonas luteoviolacea]|uniref:class I SAM-dependent methyltransferase n=1 Tax=Pseudoalteromonas luteoviolacea TaxID=43657 RepID=UPI001B3980E8|nr:class I SAM-dependent methyltransferase [Pseudoalteromonas luteoviolacea]MBQ4811317.1 class I SAM-dependent methyltransferase [Pseudoalteromonas luteoviolacea]